MDHLALTPTLSIPLAEFDFAFARSGGPGGQHVNRAETKVELRWDIAHSPSLSEPQRATLQSELARFLTDDGVLVLTSSESRSQHRNRESVLARLQALAAHALRPRRSRRATRPSGSARAERLQRKRQHSQKKAGRGRVAGWEE